MNTKTREHYEIMDELLRLYHGGIPGFPYGEHYIPLLTKWPVQHHYGSCTIKKGEICFFSKVAITGPTTDERVRELLEE